jgi:hypothetical protein
MVRLNVSRESTVEEAVNELLMSGTALDAQPNYLYSVDDSMTPGQIALRAMQENSTADDASDPSGDGSKGGDAIDAEATDVVAGQDDASEDELMALVDESEGLDAVDGEGHVSPDNVGDKDLLANGGGADDIDDTSGADNTNAPDDKDGV